MSLSTRGILGAALLLAAFASGASAQTTLRYQFKQGDKLPYVIDQKMKMNMNIMNMDIETKMDMTMHLWLNVVEVNKDGSAQIQFKVSEAKMAMNGPMGKIEVDSKDKEEPNDPTAKILAQVVKAIGSMEMTGEMLPTGDTKNVKVSEATAKALQSIPGADKAGDISNADSLKSMLGSVVFPTEAVMKGKTWTHKQEAKTPLGKTVNENTYTYEGATEQGGKTLEKIAFKPSMKIDPDPKADVTVKLKDAKGSGQVLFDNKAGRLVEITTTQTTEMQLNAMGLDLEQRIEQTTTLRMKK